MQLQIACLLRVLKLRNLPTKGATGFVSMAFTEMVQRWCVIKLLKSPLGFEQRLPARVQGAEIAVM